MELSLLDFFRQQIVLSLSSNRADLNLLATGLFDATFTPFSKIDFSLESKTQ